MFPLNTIIAWSINIIMNKKYDNNNIIIASRAYFLHVEEILRMHKLQIMRLAEPRLGHRIRLLGGELLYGKAVFLLLVA
jgi:hypothetical protein